MSGESIPGRGICQCKGPVVGMCLTDSENSREGSVAGGEGVCRQEKMKSVRYTGPDHPGPSRLWERLCSLSEGRGRLWRV